MIININEYIKNTKADTKEIGMIKFLLSHIDGLNCDINNLCERVRLLQEHIEYLDSIYVN